MANDKDRNMGLFLFGNGCMLLATIFWGVNIPVTKALIPKWMTPDGIAVARLAGGAILFWLTSLFLKCESIHRGDWARIFLAGTVGLFAFIYLLTVSLRFGNAIDVSIIMTLPPMFVILIGVIFLHNRPSLLEYLGVAVSFAGAVIVILGGSTSSAASDPLLGNLLALASTLCYAFYLVIIEKPSREYHPLSLLRWVFLFAALPAIFIMPGMQNMGIIHSDHLAPWLEIAFIVFCPTFFAYFLVQPALKNIGSELVSLYQYLMPVVASITAILMGMEGIRLAQVLAMCAVIAGMILTNIGKRRRGKKAAANA